MEGHYVGGEALGAVFAADLTQGWDPIAASVGPGAHCGCPAFDWWAGCGNGSCQFAELLSAGSRSATADNLEFSARGLNSQVLARLVMGPGITPARPLGDGTLCVTPPRTLTPRMTPLDGQLHVPRGILGRANAQLGAAGVVLAGETWVFQVMYDEPRRIFGCATQQGHGGGIKSGRPYLVRRGFNLTAGLSVTFRP